jgi:hypothetical protein
MNPKLQLLPVTNHGVDSVVRDTDSTSNTEITSNDAGPDATDVCTNAPLEPVLPPSTAKATQPRAAVPHGSVLQSQRCEVARSAGYDPTGEHAVPCGALAQVVCEYCGPMCSTCAEETFCYYGEHKFVDLDQSQTAEPVDPEALSQPSKPLFEVIYLALTCPHCKQVRLALPLAFAPDADCQLACPICSAPSTWRYLAHGITQRELPFHELFAPGAPNKGRIPWDKLVRLLDEDDDDDL